MNININRTQAIAGLKTLRQEWEEALKIPLDKSDMGLLLADVVEAIGLTLREQIVVLGYTPELVAAIQMPFTLPQKTTHRQLELPQMALQLVYA